MRALLRKTEMLLVVLTLQVGMAGIPCFGESKIPEKSALKARVRQYYAASIDRNWTVLLDLMAPFARECISTEALRAEWEKDGIRILSWRLVEIRHDPIYVGEELKVACSGKSYRVEAGALVTASQLDQVAESPAERGESSIRWVFVQGIWYAAGPQ